MWARRRFIGAGLTAAASAATGRMSILAARGRKKKRKRKKDPRAKALFYDDFKRGDRQGWGSPWLNQRYQRWWVVRNRRGVYRLPPGVGHVRYRPNPILVLDHDAAAVDIKTVFSTSNRTARIGVVARAQDYARYYVAYLGAGDYLRIGRCDHQKMTVLKERRVAFGARHRYRMRVQVKGSTPTTLRVKVWRNGAPEPSSWTLEAVDDSQKALTGAGAFGLFMEHATDGRGAAMKVGDFVAWSGHKPQVTSPAIAYSLVGPTYKRGDRVRAVAKTAVPARVFFEYGTEPTLSQGVRRIAAGRTSKGSETARSVLDLSDLDPSSVVYWRAVAERKGVRSVGPTSRFRTPPDEGLPVRFAFGSCTRWRVHPRLSFEQARLKLPDFYLHQGDLGYVLTKAVAHAPDAYQDHWVRMLMEPYLAGMVREVPFAFSQDDADYGIDQADRHTLRRFSIKAFDDLHANPPGPYFTFRYGDVAVFSIDCRRFSTGTKVPERKRSKLGSSQKRWLKDVMRAAARDPSVGLLVVASPQAFGSDLRAGSWSNHYSSEWEELIDFFTGLQAPVLICSGDLHGHRLHEYPQKAMEPDVPRIVEFCSSGTEQQKFFDDVDPRILLKHARGSGFGMVEVGPAEEIAPGQTTRSLTVTAYRSSDGSPFWTQQYMLVQGVGILPLGLP